MTLWHGWLFPSNWEGLSKSDLESICSSCDVYLAYLFVSYVENTVLKNSKILSSRSRFAIFWLPFTQGYSKLIPLLLKSPPEQGQQPAVTQSESSCRLPVTSGDVTSEVNHLPKIDILEWPIRWLGERILNCFITSFSVTVEWCHLRQPVRALVTVWNPSAKLYNIIWCLYAWCLVSPLPIHRLCLDWIPRATKLIGRDSRLTIAVQCALLQRPVPC